MAREVLDAQAYPDLRQYPAARRAAVRRRRLVAPVQMASASSPARRR